eukprot:COSAG03_NODE_14359_length_467_cov_0.834239_1_plen_80_part_01
MEGGRRVNAIEHTENPAATGEKPLFSMGEKPLVLSTKGEVPTANGDIESGVCAFGDGVLPSRTEAIRSGINISAANRHGG